MPQLRIALAQVNTTVGDLEGNAELVLAWTRRAAAAGARIVVFPEMALTGYPVEDLALRASFVEASVAALHGLAARLAAAGPGRDRGRGRLPGPPHRPGPAGRAAGRRPAGRRGAAARRPGGGHLGQAPPAQLRRVRRVPLLRARRHGAGVPAARRGRRAGGRGHRHLRGPVAGRRPGGGLRPGQGRAAGGAQRLALRAGQGRRPARAVPAPGQGGGRRAGLRQPGRRPGRAGLRRRLDHRGRGGHAAGPRAAVRGGAGRHRPGAAGRRPGAAAGPGGGRRAGRHDHDDPAGIELAAEPAAPADPDAPRRGPSGPGWTTWPRSTRRWFSGSATT